MSFLIKVVIYTCKDIPRRVANNFSCLWNSASTSIEILFLFSDISFPPLFILVCLTKVHSLIYRTLFAFRKSLIIYEVFYNFFFDIRTFLRKFWYFKKLLPSYTTRYSHCKKHCFYNGFRATFFLTFALFSGNFVKMHLCHTSPVDFEHKKIASLTRC